VSAEIQRDSLDVDVLIVGAGPAGLACAIHLSDLIAMAREKGELKGAAASDEFTLMVIEKSAEVGDHMLSGAVLDPHGLEEVVPDWRNRQHPLTVPVKQEAMFFLTRSGKIKIPYTPPALNNHGNYIVSLNQFARWLNGIAGEKGVEVYTKMAGARPLFENGRLTGVITDDKGMDKNGSPRSNFEAGVELRAKITILAEGPRGSLTKEVLPKLGLDESRNPQSYLTGVKELWEIPAGKIQQGTVYHTLGFPLGMSHFGGSWIYAMSDTLLSIGLASALAHQDPRFDPHGAFQEFKTHPWIRLLLDGGKMVKYGAKTISEGGCFAVPKLYHDGLMLIGESAGFLNSMRLKGIHLALKSGVMAARTAFQALAAENYSAAMLSDYEKQFRASWAHQELWSVRNFHQGYEKGLVSGALHTAAQMVTGGRGFTARLGAKPDHLHIKKLSELPEARQTIQRKFDGVLTFDKLTDVFASGTKHEENQPAHLKVLDTNICVDRCTTEYGNPCQYFCPAQVYEMMDDDSAVGSPHPTDESRVGADLSRPMEGEQGRKGEREKDTSDSEIRNPKSEIRNRKRLQINASNCVHCKTCDIADPYGIITWTVPEGGGGPVYGGM